MNIFFPPFQDRVFIFFFIIGVALGIIYDLFKIKRRLFGQNIVGLFIDDIVFSFLSCIIVLVSVFVFNNGIVRWFEFVMCMCGFIIYRITLSKLLLTIFYCVIDSFRRALKQLAAILFLPFYKTAFPLFRFCYRMIYKKSIFFYIKSLSPLRK